MYRKAIAMALLITSIHGMTQKVMPLYAGKIPNAIANTEKEDKTITETGHLRYAKVTVPTLEVHLPKKDKATGAAVVIVPGGAYGFVSYTNEGTEIADAFNKIGVAAFILKYRLPSDKTMADKKIGPLQDAQQAIQGSKNEGSRMGHRHCKGWNYWFLSWRASCLNGRDPF
jgi:acetyl esterase/lipase